MKFFVKSLMLVGLMVALSCCGDKKTAVDNTPKKGLVVPVRKAGLTRALVKKKEKKVEDDAKSLVAKFAPTKIGVDEAKIPKKHRPVFKKLIEAARLMDNLFLNQVSSQNEKWRATLAGNPNTADELKAFDIMYGPWNRLDHNKPFWGNVEKPKGATFYPEGMTKETLEKWIADHPKQKDAFAGYFTVIEKDGEGLKAVPYSEAYKKWLEPAAKLLNEAAKLSDDKHLAKFLKSRAAAFVSNEYRQSDMDWMDLGNGDIEVVIGPYEVYEDEIMGYKAAFEAFVTLRDAKDSKELAKIKALLPKMEAYLPIPDNYKNPNRGSESPISVVDVLFAAGDARSGVQTLAFNLPNDEVVREKKGSKKVMLKNVAHAKFDQILMPIANRLMRADQVEKITFKAFFNHTLVHETAHGVGPGKITVEKNGKKVKTSVNAELKDLYSAIEECKADILGAYLNFMLIEEGLHKKSFMEETYASLLGGFFRAVRFGAGEAHGKSNIIQFNWFIEKGAVIMEDGKYVYVPEKMKEAIKSLSHEVLMIEAEGSYDKAKAMIDKYGNMPQHLAKALKSLDDIPTDLFPTYPAEKMMEKW